MGFGGLKTKFWGTRGWVSSPSALNRKYGGNTCAIQIINDDKIIVVDSGFGITNFGDTLFGKQNLDIHIFYTQFKWDHCQGLPFFLPIYFPANTITLHSPHPEDVIHNQLNTLFDSSYSPFEGLRKMPANIHCRSIKQGETIAGVKVNFAATNQGDLINKQAKLATFAYRFEDICETSVTVVLNHETVRNTKHNQAIIELGKNTNLLIHDAFFTAKELKQHKGWGHSSAEQALANAKAMSAKATLFGMHNPYVTDNDILKLLAQLKKKANLKKLIFDFAREEIEYSAIGDIQDTYKKAG